MIYYAILKKLLNLKSYCIFWMSSIQVYKGLPDHLELAMHPCCCPCIFAYCGYSLTSKLDLHNPVHTLLIFPYQIFGVFMERVQGNIQNATLRTEQFSPVSYMHNAQSLGILCSQSGTFCKRFTSKIPLSRSLIFPLMIPTYRISFQLQQGASSIKQIFSELRRN